MESSAWLQAHLFVAATCFRRCNRCAIEGTAREVVLPPLAWILSSLDASAPRLPTITCWLSPTWIARCARR